MKNNLDKFKIVILVFLVISLVVCFGVGARYFVEKNNKNSNLPTVSDKIFQNSKITVNGASNYYNCGLGKEASSTKCFADYAKDCSLAKVGDPNGYMELKIDGFQNDNCIININVDASTKELVCRIPKKELGDIYTFSTYLELAFSGKNTACSGSAADFVKNKMSDEEKLAKQTIDSQKVSDLSNLKGAVSLYFFSVDDKNLNLSVCKKGVVYSSDKGTQAVDGTGWLPIDFTKIPDGGSPISKLPSPKNYYVPSLQSSMESLGSYPYLFSCDLVTKKFELKTKLSSNNSEFYEVGTDF